MAIDVDTPQSPGWWMRQLGRKLNDRLVGRGWSRTGRRDTRPGLTLLHDYFRGEPPLPQCADGWRKGFADLLRLSRLNVAPMAVEPTRHRMVPLGFRTAAAGDESSGDAQADRIARANDLPVKFPDIAQWMLELGDAYSIVGKPNADGVPLITAEDPRQVITAHDAATGDYLAGLKVFRDDWDTADFAYLYLASGDVFVATRKAKSSLIGTPYYRFSPSSWSWDEDRSGSLPYSVVPVTRFRNQDGKGEFEPHLDLLDRINNSILDRVTVSKIQAFRQRAVKGLPDRYPPGHPQAGQKIDYSDVFEADPGALWKVPPNVDFWESTPTDLGPIRMAIKDDVEWFAALTSVPLHTVTPDAANGSAEGASLLREGQTFKVEDRRMRAGVGLARTMSLAFQFMGDEQRADRSMIETIWAPAERYSLQEKSQAAAQQKAAGVPDAMIAEKVLQWSPSDIARAKQERADEFFTAVAPTSLASLAQPVPNA